MRTLEGSALLSRELSSILYNAWNEEKEKRICLGMTQVFKLTQGGLVRQKEHTGRAIQHPCALSGNVE